MWGPKNQADENGVPAPLGQAIRHLWTPDFFALIFLLALESNEYKISCDHCLAHHI